MDDNKKEESFISIETKKNQEFQNLLANMSRADAQHDIPIFKSKFKENKNILNAFAKGLPVYPNESLDEEKCLKQIFINQTQKKDLEEILDEVPNVTQSKDGSIPTTFDIGFTNVTLHNYTCVKFIIECSTNKLKNLTPANGDIGINFCKNTDLCGSTNNAIFVVDFNQHGFLSIFKEGTASSLYNIHYVISPEVINDPAGKTSIYDSIFSSNNNKGITLNSYVQADVEDSLYSKYDSSIIATNNNFFSNYKFRLSPVQKIYTKQKAEKLITNLYIDWVNDKGQPFTCIVSDSKGENSNATVTGFITRIFNEITGTNSDAANWKLNTKCQQKRGGDWFQALSCLNIYQHEFTNMQSIIKGANAFPDSYPVYFVTHDRIAVTFALLMGVNVIYLDYYGQVYVFKNQGDPNTKSSGKSYEEGLFEMLREKASSSSVGPNELSKYLSFNKNYLVARESILKKDFQEISSNFLNGNKEIDFLDIKNSKFIANFQKTVKNLFQTLFPEIVKNHFLNTNLLDTKEDVDFIEKNQDILLENEYKEELKEQVLNLYKAFSRIYSVYSQHQGGSKDLIENSILLWANNVNKLDIYRSAKNVLNIESYQDKETFDVRLLNYNTNTDSNEKRANDIYIFLPYIQTIQDNTKKIILDFINGPLLSKTMDYRDKISTGKSVFRLGRLSPNEVFFNQIANFIYDARIFISLPPPTIIASLVEGALEKAEEVVEEVVEDLGQAEQTEVGQAEQTEVGQAEQTEEEVPPQSSPPSNIIAENIEPFISLSTDAIVIAEDFYEIDLYNKGKGKLSNSTDQVIEEEPENPKQMGGFSYYENKDPSKKINNDVIQDMSIKQITWPLLTNLLISFGVSNLNKKKIQKYLIEREMLESIIPLKNNKKRSFSEEEGKEERQEKKKSKISGGKHANANLITVEELENILSEINKNESESLSLSFLNSKESKIGYHPLVPIYMILTSMWNFIEPSLESNSFYYSYINYFNCLEKMTDVIIDNYLDTNKKALSAYFIGFSLKPFLFTLSTNEEEVEKMAQLIDVGLNKFRLFSLKNDMFSNNVAGHLLLDEREEQLDTILLKSELFKHFLLQEVELPNYINSGLQDNMLSTDEFQERVYQVMSKIVKQVQKDAKYKEDDDSPEQPIVSSLTNSLTSSSNSIPIKTNTNTRKTIDKQGNIVEVPIEPKKTGIFTLQDFPSKPLSSNNSSPSYVTTSSSINTNKSFGGKNKTIKKHGKTVKRVVKTVKKYGKKHGKQGKTKSKKSKKIVKKSKTKKQKKQQKN